LALEVLVAAPLSRRRRPVAQLADERRHPFMVALEALARGIDAALKTVHHQPQQSVLSPQDGQRQTACMRNISAPQRSHMTFSEPGSGVLGAEAGRRGVGLVGSGIWGDYSETWGVWPRRAYG